MINTQKWVPIVYGCYASYLCVNVLGAHAICRVRFSINSPHRFVSQRLWLKCILIRFFNSLQWYSSSKNVMGQLLLFIRTYLMTNHFLSRFFWLLLVVQEIFDGDTQFPCPIHAFQSLFLRKNNANQFTSLKRNVFWFLTDVKPHFNRMKCIDFVHLVYRHLVILFLAVREG